MSSTATREKPSVKSSVMKFMKTAVNRRKAKTFTGVEVESVNQAHPLSGLRTLRKLRENNVLNYVVVDRRKSLYRLTSINY